MHQAAHADMPEPKPGKGQALVRTHSCGMCASEQHFLHAGRNIIAGVAFDARIVMGGYCMEAEQFYVFAAPNKRLTIHFAAGEEQQDMELALRSIADGKIDVRPWLSGRIGLGAVADAVVNMSGPLAPIRSVIDPRKL